MKNPKLMIPNEGEALREFLELEAIEFTTGKHDSIFTLEGSFDECDLIRLGMEFGVWKERKKWTAPETLQISGDYGKLLLEALKTGQKHNRLTNDSVKWKEEDGRYVFTIRPTAIGFLFDWFRFYGEACKKQECEAVISSLETIAARLAAKIDDENGRPVEDDEIAEAFRLCKQWEGGK